MFSIDIRGGAPIYEQLYNRISELISSGTLVENEKLPAVREVAKEMGINPNTVQKAYQLLEQKGLIYSVPAKGSYVSSADAAIDMIRGQAEKTFRVAAQTALRHGLTKEELHDALDKL